MYLYTFNSLDENAKAEHVWQSYQYLGSIIIDKTGYSLYANKVEQAYFIEFVIIKNKITAVNSFIKGELLNKYIDKINLAGLQS